MVSWTSLVSSPPRLWRISSCPFYLARQERIAIGIRGTEELKPLRKQLVFRMYSELCSINLPLHEMKLRNGKWHLQTFSKIDFNANNWIKWARIIRSAMHAATCCCRNPWLRVLVAVLKLCTILSLGPPQLDINWHKVENEIFITRYQFIGSSPNWSKEVWKLLSNVGFSRLMTGSAEIREKTWRFTDGVKREWKPVYQNKVFVSVYQCKISCVSIREINLIWKLQYSMHCRLVRLLYWNSLTTPLQDSTYVMVMLSCPKTMRFERSVPHRWNY